MSESTVTLGSKYACSACGIKYYDLGREDVRCPRCGAPPEPIGITSIAAKKKGGAKKGKKADMYEPRLGEEADEEILDEEEFDEAAFGDEEFGEELPDDEEVLDEDEGDEGGESEDED